MRKRILAGALVVLTIITLLPALAMAAAKPIEKVYFDVSSIVMGRNDTYDINVTTTPNDADKTKLTWTVDDSRLASVSNGVIKTKNVYGGCIVTATAPNGSTSRLYVGVGSPYGYTGGYYNGYYPGDWSYYNYPIVDSGYYYPNNNYPSTYNYPNYNYNYGYYNDPYSSVYYNDYYNDKYYSYYYPGDSSTYVNKNGQIVYSINRDNPVTYVKPGSATSTALFALEVQQGIDTAYDGASVGFGYVQANSALVITPERTGTMTNSASIPSRTLSRLKRFNLNSVKYRLPNIEISMSEDLDLASAFTLSVKKVKSELDELKTIVGPYDISIPSSEQGLSIRFILDQKVSRSNVRVVKIDTNGEFKDVNSELWTLKKTNSPGYDTYIIELTDVSQGTFAVVKN